MIKARTFWDRAGIVALAALLTAGCSSSDATGSRPAPANPTTATSTAAGPLGARGVEGSIGDVPWSLVGPGWMLATWSSAVAVAPGETPPEGSPSQDSPETLYLVNPAGGRYALTTVSSTPDQRGETLVDWSGDGTHAVFARGIQGASSVITAVDLHSGTRTSFTVDYGFPSPHFTRPDGKALLLTTKNNGLVRVDLAGNLQLTYPTDKLSDKFTGGFLYTPDGTQLVFGTSAGLALMGNDGTVGKALPLAGTSGCSPVRWSGEGAKIVLAQCNSNGQPPQLWQIPVDGRAPTALTAPITDPYSHDSGDVDAWQLPGGTFVQYLGGCGSIFLGKLNPDGTTSKVSVPNVDLSHSIYVIGAHDGNLDLQANVAGCGPAQSLLDYDPVAGTATVLLGPPLNGGSVIKALPFKGEQ